MIRYETEQPRRPRSRAVAVQTPKGKALAAGPIDEPVPSAPDRGASMAIGERRSRAQAAAALEPAGRDSPRIFVRMTAAELAHLDEIRGAFSRQDAIRLLLRSAERLGL